MIQKCFWIDLNYLGKIKHHYIMYKRYTIFMNIYEKPT